MPPTRRQRVSAPEPLRGSRSVKQNAYTSLKRFYREHDPRNAPRVPSHPADPLSIPTAGPPTLPSNGRADCPVDIRTRRIVANLATRTSSADELRSALEKETRVFVAQRDTGGQDRPGFLYSKEVVLPNGLVVYKIGYTGYPEQRRAQLALCFRWRWEAMWMVPSEKLSEKDAHAWFSDAWIGRVKCANCPRRHKEHFDAQLCGGREGLVNAMERLIRSRKWDVCVVE